MCRCYFIISQKATFWTNILSQEYSLTSPKTEANTIPDPFSEDSMDASYLEKTNTSSSLLSNWLDRKWVSLTSKQSKLCRLLIYQNTTMITSSNINFGTLTSKPTTSKLSHLKSRYTTIKKRWDCLMLLENLIICRMSRYGITFWVGWMARVDGRELRLLRRSTLWLELSLRPRKYSISTTSRYFSLHLAFLE